MHRIAFGFLKAKAQAEVEEVGQLEETSRASELGLCWWPNLVGRLSWIGFLLHFLHPVHSCFFFSVTLAGEAETRK